jgi:hypothetical protein
VRRGRSVRGGWWLAAGIASGTALGVAGSRLRTRKPIVPAPAPPPLHEPEPVAFPKPVADRPSRRRRVGLVTALLALAALGAGIATVVARDSAGTAPATAARPAPTTHGVLRARTTRQRPPRTTAPPARTASPKPTTRAASTTDFVPARVFAWPAAPGADGYLIQFFRGDRVVLERRLAEAHFPLPSAFRLVPGKYRWLVMPRADGKYGRAVVDSRFSIGRG